MGFSEELVLLATGWMETGDSFCRLQIGMVEDGEVGSWVKKWEVVSLELQSHFVEKIEERNVLRPSERRDR